MVVVCGGDVDDDVDDGCGGRRRAVSGSWLVPVGTSNAGTVNRGLVGLATRPSPSTDMTPIKLAGSR